MLKLWISRPCWILSKPRTGSTYLSHFLECTHLFDPRFVEWYDHSAGPKTEKRLQKFARPKKLPRFCKVHRRQIEYWNVDVDQLDKNLPGIRFIVIDRLDQYAQAVSFYFANRSSLWVIKKPEELESFQQCQIPYNQDILRHLVLRLNDPTQNWDNFVKDKEHLHILYEDLINKPIETFSIVLKFLGIPLRFLNISLTTMNDNSNNQSKKADHPQKEEYVLRLRKSFQHTYVI